MSLHRGTRRLDINRAGYIGKYGGRSMGRYPMVISSTTRTTTTPITTFPISSVSHPRNTFQSSSSRPKWQGKGKPILMPSGHSRRHGTGLLRVGNGIGETQSRHSRTDNHFERLVACVGRNLTTGQGVSPLGFAPTTARQYGGVPQGSTTSPSRVLFAERNSPRTSILQQKLVLALVPTRAGTSFGGG